MKVILVLFFCVGFANNVFAYQELLSEKFMQYDCQVSGEFRYGIGEDKSPVVETSFSDKTLRLKIYKWYYVGREEDALHEPAREIFFPNFENGLQLESNDDFFGFNTKITYIKELGKIVVSFDVSTYPGTSWSRNRIRSVAYFDKGTESFNMEFSGKPYWLKKAKHEESWLKAILTCTRRTVKPS